MVFGEVILKLLINYLLFVLVVVVVMFTIISVDDGLLNEISTSTDSLLSVTKYFDWAKLTTAAA